MPSEDPSSPLSSHRSDGRRGVDIEHTPALNKASKLYGQPNWWGEGQGEGQEAKTAAWEKEFEFVKPGSQILRQLDSPEGTKRDFLSSTPPKLSSKDELRLQAIANTRSQELSSSWVVDFGAGGKGGTMPRVRRPRDRNMRPRSADPSPNRAYAAMGRRETSPAAPKRATTPTSAKRHSSFSNTGAKSATPTKKQVRATTPTVLSSSGGVGASTKKPPPGSPKKKSVGKPLSGDPKSKTPQAKSATPKSQLTPQSCPPDSSSPPSDSSHTHHQAPEDTPTSATPTPASPLTKDPCIDLKSLNDGTLRQLMGSSETEEGEETYTVAPPSSSGDDDESLSSLSEQTLDKTRRGGGVAGDSPRTKSGRGGRSGIDEKGVASGEGKASSSRRQWSTDEVKLYIT